MISTQYVVFIFVLTNIISKVSKCMGCGSGTLFENPTSSSLRCVSGYKEYQSMSMIDVKINGNIFSHRKNMRGEY